MHHTATCPTILGQCICPLAKSGIYGLGHIQQYLNVHKPTKSIASDGAINKTVCAPKGHIKVRAHTLTTKAGSLTIMIDVKVKSVHSKDLQVVHDNVLTYRSQLQ